MIVNEKLLKRFDIGEGDPTKAIGEVIKVWGKPMEIIGVVRDFHNEKINREIDPFLFRYSANDNIWFVNARIQSPDIASTMKKIEQAWKKIDPVHALRARFYSDQLKRAYDNYSSMMKSIGFLSCLSIAIAFMGLLGMVVYSTETKIKEIGIRKVFGASLTNLIFLLSRSFLILLSVSAVLAIPLTYLLFERLILVNVVYHPPIGLLELTAGSLGVILAALALIGSQTFKIARSNPSEVLRTE